MNATHRSIQLKKVKTILAKLDCQVYEDYCYNPYEEIYSVRIESGDKIGNFSSYGKGKTRISALANAHIKFISKLQNGQLNGPLSLSRINLNKIKSKTDFYYYPDEKFISQKEFNKLPSAFLNDISTTDIIIDNFFDRLLQNGYNGCLSVPFFNVKTNKTQYLPYNICMMLTGTNGMAAGNTKSEATFLALCKIIERYCASEIYYNELTPPTIPRDFLKTFESEYKIIKRIEKSGSYEIIVKDFSAGKHLPVLGLIIKNKKNKKYKLSIGANISFRLALSRCVMKIYQGIENKKIFEKTLITIPKIRQDYFINSDRKSLAHRRNQFSIFCHNITGVFPKSLFDVKENYLFDKNIFNPYVNYEKGVEKLLKKIIKLDHNIYIRDVSFLGYPSVYIYITSLSSVKNNLVLSSLGSVNLDNSVRIDKIEDLFFPFRNCTSKKMIKLANMIDVPYDEITTEMSNISYEKMKSILKLEFTKNSSWFSLPSCFFTVLFYYKVGMIKDAIRNLKFFMKITGNEKDDYYKIVLKYLELKDNELSECNIKEKLNVEKFSIEIIEEVISDMSDKNNLFERIAIPACPDCNKCPLRDECLTKSKIEYTEKINNEMKKYNIIQKLVGCAKI